MWWIPRVIFIGLGHFIVIATELREREKNTHTNDSDTPSPTQTQPTLKTKALDSECCGQHAVCERDLLLNQKPDIIYYDDEELDALSGISPVEYTEEQYHSLEEVFYTLQEKDVAGWLKSLQLRNITLPNELRDEALLIVSERRRKSGL